MCHRSVGDWTQFGEFPYDKPLIAYRTWLEIDGNLTSWWKKPRFVWEPEMSAVCARDESHNAPLLQCSCGLHAFGEQVELEPFAYPSRRGVVALYGRVLVSSDIQGGANQLYRAEHARIMKVDDRIIPAKQGVTSGQRDS